MISVPYVWGFQNISTAQDPGYVVKEKFSPFSESNKTNNLLLSHGNTNQTIRENTKTAVCGKVPCHMVSRCAPSRVSQLPILVYNNQLTDHPTSVLAQSYQFSNLIVDFRHDIASISSSWVPVIWENLSCSVGPNKWNH